MTSQPRTPGPTDLDAVERLVAELRLPEPIFVTRPTMPSREAYQELLGRLWETRWLTNDGEFHGKLGEALTAYLGVEHLNLCCNGTIALLIALQSFELTGEVITTPFTFPATVHALHWNRIRPVFCDVDDESFNIDPRRIESLIGPDTTAILGVHVFGNPCDVEAIQSIADEHGLRVLYDAAHVMGVRYRGRSILEWGDCSILSFHATKLFSTVEGGAIVSRTRAQRERIDFLKNFGIQDEETVIGPGINGKLNELQAAFGLLQLQGIDEEIANRRRVCERYRERLAGVPGLRIQHDRPEVRHNYAYFPVLVDPGPFGMDRNRLHRLLARFGVHARKYFYPLCSRYECYAALPSARPEDLPVAERVAERVLCLPLYGTLPEATVETVCEIIAELQRLHA